MPEETYRKMGQNGKQGARDFDYKVLTQKLISVMELYLKIKFLYKQGIIIIF